MVDWLKGDRKITNIFDELTQIIGDWLCAHEKEIHKLRKQDINEIKVDIHDVIYPPGTDETALMGAKLEYTVDLSDMPDE